MLTGRPALQRAAQNALIKIERYTEASGTAVSGEWIKELFLTGSLPHMSTARQKELQLTL